MRKGLYPFRTCGRVSCCASYVCFRVFLFLRFVAIAVLQINLCGVGVVGYILGWHVRFADGIVVGVLCMGLFSVASIGW